MSPFVCAINAAGTRLYVANFNSGDVSMLNAETGAFISLTGGFTNPFGVAVSPITGDVYVSDTGTHMIHRFDADMIPIGAPVGSGGTSPRFIALNPTGTILYVANSGNDLVAAFDPSTLLQIGVSVATGGTNANAVAVNPAGDRVYVTNAGDGFITRYDASLGSALTVPPAMAMSGPVGIAFHPDGSAVYIANTGLNTVDILNPDLVFQSSLASGGLNPYVVAINPEGTRLYVTNSTDGFMNIYNLSDLSLNANIAGFSNPFGIAFGPFSSSGDLTSISGSQKNNNFGLLYELFNFITWESENVGSAGGFYVYRDGVKIATLDTNTLSYEDHNRPPGVAFTYSVVYFDGTGLESAPLSVVIQ